MRDDMALAPEVQIAPEVEASAGERPPPKRIKVLLPVWGYDFINQFVNVSLPTLLAPGNVPALAATLPTEFIFLTSRVDESIIRGTPRYRKLAEICDVRFLFIDDLITEGNHSTTVTLGYTRAVRESGEDMLDTCFFFLVSDYIVADGSLRSVIKHMMAGASAIQTGNFQVVEEDLSLWLAEGRREAGTDALIFSPRKLMQLALASVHPVTIANTVNIPVSHNSYPNRLFWRVDSNTLVGRFFLMHMLCIRPQIVDFIIGASCDYSFIPEMCPTGQVLTITDSDEYLVIEAQPRHHESQYLRLGKFELRKLAASLSEWTTLPHRGNARHTLVFHASDIPEIASPIIAEADELIAKVSRLLKDKPAPFRGHPYWQAAMAAHHANIGVRPDEADWDLVLGHKPGWKSRLRRQLRQLVLGRVPHVRRWHPRRIDYAAPVKELTKILTNPGTRLLVVSKAPTPLSNWLADYSDQTVRTPTGRLLRPDFSAPDAVPVRFDACLLEVEDNEIDHVHLIVDRIVPLLKPSGTLLVVSFNTRWFVGADTFGNTFALHSQQFFGRLDVSLNDVEFVTASNLRWKANAELLSSCIGFSKLSRLAAVFRAIRILVLLPVAAAANAIAWGRVSRIAVKGKIISSWFLQLQLSPGWAEQGWNPRRQSHSFSRHRDRSVQALGTKDGSQTREPQYSRLLEIKEEIGLTPLGLMTNQVWEEDPRRLAILLSRYKFVAKMLGGWTDVAEVGCGDAFGTRLVLQEVERVTVYDFDPVFIDDIRSRFAPRWPIVAHPHDILTGPLPRRHNAIFSLDVIEHIPLEQEDLYLRNLHDSLTEAGVLIIGTPSLESQLHASPQSKVGHVNCKSGNELKASLKRYFHNVFLFSMNDEVVHTGFYPMAHYLFAICAMKI